MTFSDRSSPEFLDLIKRSVEQSHTVFVITDGDANIEYVNPAFEDLTGYTSDEVVGENPRILKSGYHPDEFYAEMWNEIQRNGMWVGTLCNRKKDGTLFWEKSVISVVRDTDGKPTHYIATKEDVTDLRHSEERNRLVVKNSPVGIMFYSLIDGKLVLTDSNPAADALTGKDISSLHGLTIDRAFPDLTDKVMGKYRKVCVDGGAHTYRDMRYDDGSISGFFDVSIFRNSENSLVVTFVNTTDEKRMRDALIRSNENLSQFAYVVSHDLKEPLRAMSNFAYLLGQNIDKMSKEKMEDYISRVISSSERMGDMIDGLLTYSRMTRNDKGFRNSLIRDIVDESVKNLANLIDLVKPKITIDVSCNEKMFCSRYAMSHVFQNLIANSLKYRRDGVFPDIGICVEKIPNFWKFSVSDNGAGIDEKDRERIFNIFERTSKFSHIKGTGIGLAVCKRIVEQHDGEIWVEDNSDGGSTFFFTISDNLKKIQNQGL